MLQKINSKVFLSNGKYPATLELSERKREDSNKSPNVQTKIKHENMYSKK
jgi:hypothetical protein